MLLGASLPNEVASVFHEVVKALHYASFSLLGFNGKQMNSSQMQLSAFSTSWASGGLGQ